MRDLFLNPFAVVIGGWILLMVCVIILASDKPNGD